MCEFVGHKEFVGMLIALRNVSAGFSKTHTRKKVLTTVKKIKFSSACLRLDAAQAVDSISKSIRQSLAKNLKRRGMVIGLSGGIDSTVTLGLCVKALGSERVFAVLMPEAGVDAESRSLGELAARHFGVEHTTENITPVLEALGHYRRYADAVRLVIPQYGTDWKSKLVTSNTLSSSRYTYFYLVAQEPDGQTHKARLPMKPYLEILAATNFKQRTRKMLEYHHADRLHYAVAGTPNRLEYELGFFVKQGDGSADIKPIAHLYKSQVYQLAEHLGAPAAIRERMPTTGTFSMDQGQDEFFFSLPYDKMDLCLYAYNNRIPAETVAPAVGLTVDQVKRIFADIDIKRSTTRYLHLPPILVEGVPGVSC
jgi:NAD+ synthase